MELDQIVNLINSNQSFLLISHVSMDGDTLGSAAALWQLLKNMGKQVQWRGDATLSEPYTDFDLFCRLHQLPQTEAIADVAIAIDCSDELRLSEKSGFYNAPHRIVIDHHLTNTAFGDVNYVKPYSATAVCIYEILQALGQPLTPEIAEALYIGINTDTGRFAHQGTDEYTMSIVAKLYGAKIDTALINDKLYKRRSYIKTKLLAEALGSLKLYHNNKAAVIVLDNDVFARLQARETDTEGIVDYGIEVRGVQVAAFIKGVGEKEYKVSLRSKCSGCNVAKIALKYGGGGHMAAAGCTIRQPIEEVLNSLLADLEKELAQ